MVPMMSFLKTAATYSTAFLCAVAITIGCTSQVPDNDGEKSEEPHGLIPDQILYESNILLSERGVKKILIQSDYLEKYSNRDSTLMTGIVATFFDTLGQAGSTLVSDSGIVREKTNTLKAWGNVKVVSDNGVTLEADSLFWDQVRDSVTTESFVRITHGDNVQTGYGLQADKSLTNIKIKRQVQAEFDDIEASERK